MYECLLSLAYEKDCKMSENTSHHGFDRNKEQLPNLFANVFVEKKKQSLHFVRQFWLSLIMDSSSGCYNETKHDRYRLMWLMDNKQSALAAKK